MQPALAAGTARRRRAGQRRPGRRQPGARRRDAGRGRQRRPGAAARLRGRPGSTRSSWPRAGWPARSRTGPRRWSTSCCAGWPPTRAGCSPSSTSSPCGSTTRARPVELTGRVDRLEVDDDGRLVVIDLKTGKSTAVTAADVAEHPQLAAYQAAVEAGAFAEYGDESRRRGAGAARHDGQGRQGADAGGRWARPTEPGWAHAMVRRTADTMAAVDVRRGGQLEVPGLPGAHQLPGLRQGPAGRRAADRSGAGRPDDPADPVRGPTQPAHRRGRRPGPRYTPVELAKLLRLPAPTPRAGRGHRRAGGAAAGGRRRRLGQDRDDGGPGGLAGRQRRTCARTQILGLTFTRKAAGELAHRVRIRLGQLVRRLGGRAGPADDLLAGEPTVATYHSYAARVVTEHGLRAGYEPATRLLTEASRWQLADRWCATTTAT